jgi:uncharacterized membrane protein
MIYPMMRKTVLLVALTAGFFATQSSAEAGLKFKNLTSETIYIAVTNFESGGWRADGWYEIKPLQTFEVISGDLTHRYYYYYGYTASKRNYWKGNHNFWIHPTQRFTILEINGNTGVLPAGAQKAGFRQVDTGPTAKNFTVTLY